MNTKEVVRFNWDEGKRLGSMYLIIDTKVISKYILLNSIYGDENGYSLIYHSYNYKKVYDNIKKEIEDFKSIIKSYELLSKGESSFHYSHLVCFIEEFMKVKERLIEQVNTNIKLYNRIYLLKELISLNQKDSFKYDVTITKLNTEFKYSFIDDSQLKSKVLSYLIEEVKEEIKNVFGIEWSNVYKDSEVGLKKRFGIISEYEIHKRAVAQIAIRIHDYLNNETDVLKNKKLDTSSITNKQGDFIYDMLTHFKIYEPERKKLIALSSETMILLESL